MQIPIGGRVSPYSTLLYLLSGLNHIPHSIYKSIASERAIQQTPMKHPQTFRHVHCLSRTTKRGATSHESYEAVRSDTMEDKFQALKALRAFEPYRHRKTPTFELLSPHFRPYERNNNVDFPVIPRRN
ncbi:hypothetical protein JTB14_031600 [Gonioctena quinquepunctata]|nr:hypothetical protein JTB14_031600 [Gonioctena quinquepunctata]